MTRQRMLMMVAAVLGLALLTATPASAAAPPTKGIAFAWDNVIIDGNAYHIRASVTTTKDGSVSTTTTSCLYFEQPAPGTPWQEWVVLGEYRVNGAQATDEASLKDFCVQNFYNKV